MRRAWAKLQVLGMYVALTVVWAACSLWLPDGLLREAIVLFWLVTMPGYIIWRVLAGYKTPSLTRKAGGYIIGLSLLFLMALGLLLNQVYFMLGASRPFSRIPLTLAISGAVVALSIAAALRNSQSPNVLKAIRNIKINPLTVVVVVSGGLLPVLAVAGATTLNNGGSAGVALVGMFAAAALLILGLFRERYLGKFNGYILYCLCVSTLLATSMRGWNITGHDVMEEYQVFQLTLSHAAWHMSYYHDAYTACLSITILPTILQKLSGVYAPYIFKFVVQAVFASLAVILYGTMRNMRARRRVALLATFLVISFPTFLTDMPMLNRQELGLLFFALVFHVGTNPQLSKRLKSVLVFLFMVGMILSHYSTSYVAIASFLAALAIGCIWMVMMRRLKRSDTLNLVAVTSIISPIVLLASLLVLIGWGTIATQTTSNITQTVQSIADIIKGSNAKPTATLLTQTTPTVTQFSLQAKSLRTLSSNNYYTSQTVNKYPLQTSTETVAPVSSISRSVHLTKSMLHAIYDYVRSAYALLIEASVSLGLVFCLIKKRTGNKLPSQYVFTGVGLMVVIALQVVLPSAINYGLTRILQQALLVLALPSIVVAIWAMQRIRIKPYISELLIGLVLATFYLVLSGAIPAITGGYKPNLTTSNSGFYYSAYYTHQDEIAASQWLAQEPPKGSRVYTDEFMRRKLITYGGIFAQPYIVPNTIPVDSYVMLSHGDLEFDQVPAYDNGNLIYYKPPFAFLQSNKSLVYSSSSVQIYR